MKSELTLRPVGFSIGSGSVRVCSQSRTTTAGDRHSSNGDALNLLARLIAEGLTASHTANLASISRRIGQFAPHLEEDAYRHACEDDKRSVQLDWRDKRVKDLLYLVSELIRSYSSMESASPYELLDVLDLLSDSIGGSDASMFNRIFVEIVPCLVLVKKLILVQTIDGLHTSSVQLLRRWLRVIRNLLVLLSDCPPDTTSECIPYITDRLLEFRVESHCINSVIRDCLSSPQVDCKTVVIIVELAQSLRRFSNFDLSTTETFSKEVASRLICLDRVMLPHCVQLDKIVVAFLSGFGDIFACQFFSMVIARYFSSHFDVIPDLLRSLQEANESVKHKLLRFACGELEFVDPDFSGPNSSGSKPGFLPSLSLDSLSPMRRERTLRSSPDTRFPLTHPSASPVRQELVAWLVKSVFKRNRKTLDSDVLDQFPALTGKEPVLFRLLRFAEWLSCQGEGDLICNRLREEGFSVMADFLFSREKLSLSTVIGSGQFGTVYKTISGTAVKLVKVPFSKSDRCTFHDALNEALCQSLCSTDSFCLPLLSCGRTDDGEAFFIESPLYASNLGTWRRSRPSISDPVTLVQMLIVFSEMLSAVSHLHADAGIVHYDLKMDNILVEFGAHADAPLVIPRIAVADFGEARITDDDVCMKNRGTECIKSPEMLSIANSIRKDGVGFDRRRAVGTTRASDIWSLGCLFFELLTGQFLFANSDGDWLAFYYRVTGESNAGNPLLSSIDEELLYERRELIEFLNFVLIRDAARRPSIDAVIRKFQKVYSSIVESLPNGVSVELPDIIPGVLRVLPGRSQFE